MSITYWRIAVYDEWKFLHFYNDTHYREHSQAVRHMPADGTDGYTYDVVRSNL